MCMLGAKMVQYCLAILISFSIFAATKPVVMNTKDIVQIRQRVMPSGRISLYLAYMLGGKRHYEYPRLYLLPEEGKAKAAAIAANKETMRVIKAMQAKLIVELTQTRGGIEVRKKPSTILWTEYIGRIVETKREGSRSESCINHINDMSIHVCKYAGDAITLADIDKTFCEGFVRYLRTARAIHRNSELAAISKAGLYIQFKMVLRQAVKDGLLPDNPANDIDARDLTRAKSAERTYLDIDEVKRMAETETPFGLTKKAFMFSCFTGLRMSDIRKLRWTDIETHTDISGCTVRRLKVRMQKTKKPISFILSQEALKWLPEDNGKELVFDGLVGKLSIGFDLRKWAEAAGITKKVTFHVASHNKISY